MRPILGIYRGYVDFHGYLGLATWGGGGDRGWHVRRVQKAE